MKIENKTAPTTEGKQIKRRRYFVVAILSYLLTWLAVAASEAIFHFIFDEPFSRLRPSGFEALTMNTFFRMCIPAFINFLILWPFLHRPILCRVVFALLFIAWFVLLSATRTGTR